MENGKIATTTLNLGEWEQLVTAINKEYADKRIEENWKDVFSNKAKNEAVTILLSERELYVLKSVFLEHESFEKIGLEMNNISRERVRQIMCKALMKMRKCKI